MIGAILASLLLAAPPVPVDAPLGDSAGNLPGGSLWLPAWGQAESVTLDELLLSHWAARRLATRAPGALGPVVQPLIAGALDAVASELPGGAGWAHEEGHRSVLIRRGIRSRNGMDDPPGTWGNAIPVYGMSDEQMAFLKEGHNADMVRLEEAGFETQIAIGLDLEARNLWLGEPALDSVPFLWANTLNDVGYLYVCGHAEKELRQYADRESIHPRRRDFTGADCDGWVYDLFRPDEPYAARGPHPSGVGIRRDRLPSDLTRGERAYLDQQTALALLALADPDYWWPTGGFAFRGGRVLPMLAHQMTSFGDAFDLDVVSRDGPWNQRFVVRLNRNRTHVFPALGWELWRHPLPAGIHVDAELSAWLQPTKQSFFASRAEPGGAAAVAIHQAVSPSMEVFARLEGKTAGWQALRPSLQPSAGVTAGVSFLLP